MEIKNLLGMILVVASLILVGCAAEESAPEAGANMEVEVGQAQWEMKSSSGEVSVNLAPLNYAAGKLIVEMAVNTHTVDDLDTYDLKEIITLIANGKEYKPITIPAISGHHSSGRLEFQVDGPSEEFTITINNFHDEGKREFRWP